jgi:hypothetical protein
MSSRTVSPLIAACLRDLHRRLTRCGVRQLALDGEECRLECCLHVIYACGRAQTTGRNAFAVTPPDYRRGTVAGRWFLRMDDFHGDPVWVGDDMFAESDCECEEGGIDDYARELMNGPHRAILDQLPPVYMLFGAVCDALDRAGKTFERVDDGVQVVDNLVLSTDDAVCPEIAVRFYSDGSTAYCIADSNGNDTPPRIFIGRSVYGRADIAHTVNGLVSHLHRCDAMPKYIGLK